MYTDKEIMFYVFCGYDRSNKWDAFWYQDIVNTFRRIELLMKYKCLPYIMRFNRYTESPYSGMYIILSRWCNQVAIFKKQSFKQFCSNRELDKKRLENFIAENPGFDLRFINMKYNN